MIQYIKRLTSGKIVSVLAVLITLTACEKNIDNTIPPDARTFTDDINTAFANITHNEQLWFWDVPTQLTEGHLMSAFYKDSSVELYLMQRYTINNQLALLANTAPLSDEEFSDVVFLYNAFRNFSDANLRLLLESPSNAFFKELTLVYLPNYPYFNGYYRVSLADQANFDINGPIQLSLTINNSDLLSRLKETRQLDYDFRIFSSSKDSVVLSGYYAYSSNKDCKLIPMFNVDAIPRYANGSALFMSVLHRRANVSIRMDGNPVTVPATYRSGIDWFYRNFADGVMNKQIMEFSFQMRNPAAADLPEVFKDVVYCTITDYFNGTYAAAPAGTVLITMEAHTAGGGKKVLEFIK